MNGRKALALSLAAVAIATSCNRYTALPVIGSLGESLAEITPPEIDRPPLRKIFEPGRFVFRPARGLERRFRALAERDPLASEGTTKIVVRIAVDRRGRVAPMYVLAAVWSNEAVQDPHTWDGFVRGVGGGGVEIETGTLRGVAFAYGKARGDQMLALDYSRDLLLRLAARPRTPRSDMETLARYLLRRRG